MLMMRLGLRLLVMWIVFSFMVTSVTVSEELINGKIVFFSIRNGNEEIYCMNADGTDVIQLTDNPASDHAPVWSPDGTKIAFVSDREWNSDIYCMNADGTNVVRLTFSFAEDLNPAWSPDGKRIAFNSDRDGLPQIYVMNADGTNVVRVTHDKDWNASPAWSPDGEKIVYSSTAVSEILTTGDIASRIRVINIDGSGRKDVSMEDDSSPRWSPDGTKIAFDSYRDGNSEIYVMNADGSQQQRLTDHLRRDHSPAWSPDEERIAFTSDRDGNFEIYIMDSDGGNIVRITENSFSDQDPDWHSQTTIPDSGPQTTPLPPEPATHPDAVPPVQVVVPPDSTRVGISWVKISYELNGSHGIHWEYWINRHDDGLYYVDMASGFGIFSSSPKTGTGVDTQYIENLAQSFTDFYPSEKAVRFDGVRLDGGTNFEVVVKLENGEILSMNTPPDYEMCCLVPWSIEFKDKKYLQSNGRITEAVLKLLNSLEEDEELLVLYDKEIRWGCYPAVLNCAFCGEELSDDFPHSKEVVTPLEKVGETYVLWMDDITGIMCPSAYTDNLMYVITKGLIMALDVETRQTVWEVQVEDSSDREGTIIVHEGMVYAGIPPYVYSLNAQTGDLMWKHTSPNRGSLQVIPVKEKLIIWEKTEWIEGRISCLDAGSGDNIWEITEDVCYLGLIGDAILYKVRKLRTDDQYFYILVDSVSGEQTWQKRSSSFVQWDSSIINWSFYDGILYVDNENEGTLIALDMEIMEERVLYTHAKFISEYDPGELVQYLQVTEEGILLSIMELGERKPLISGWNTRIVFLDKTGEIKWDYHYDKKSVGSLYCLSGLFYNVFVYNPVERLEFIGDTLYLVRRRGFIEAFDVNNGEKKWEGEIRDSVETLFIRDERMYITAKDCKVYCLDMERGRIVWELKVCDNHCTVDIEGDSSFHWPDVMCWCEYFVDAVVIGNEMLLVTTKDRLIAVSTIADLEMEEEIKNQAEIEEESKDEEEIEESKDEEEIEEKQDQEEDDKEEEQGDEEEGGFCSGTVLLLLLIIAGGFSKLLKTRITIY